MGMTELCDKWRLSPLLPPTRPTPQNIMATDYEQLWKVVTDTTDDATSVPALAGVLADREGRGFVSRLGRKQAELCVAILDRVSHDPHSAPFHPLRLPRQSIAKLDIESAERDTFLVTLMGLAG